MVDGLGPVGVSGGHGYPAPLKGVSRFPDRTAPSSSLPRASSVVTDTRVLVLGQGSWVLPPRCQIRFDARAGIAHVRTGDQIWTVADDGSTIQHTDDEHAVLLEAWSLL